MIIDAVRLSGSKIELFFYFYIYIYIYIYIYFCPMLDVSRCEGLQNSPSYEEINEALK
jgi:hypothetical protein